MAMDEPLRIDPGERPADEILTALHEGRRVILDVDVAGDSHEVVLRYDGETYRCDTPTSLHRHAEEAEMRGCLHRMGYAADD